MHPARQLPVQSSRCAWLIDDDSEDAVKSHVDEANDRLVKNTLVNLATRHQQVTSFERIREPHSVYCAIQNQGIEARSSTDSQDNHRPAPIPPRCDVPGCCRIAATPRRGVSWGQFGT